MKFKNLLLNLLTRIEQIRLSVCLQTGFGPSYLHPLPVFYQVFPVPKSCTLEHAQR